VQYQDAFCLTGIQKPNAFDVHEINLFQIQSGCSTTLDLDLHLIKLPESKRTAKPNPRSVFAREAFNL
jgi:hypothetical protein